MSRQSSQSSFTTTDTSPPADPPRRTLRLGRRRVVESIEVVEESESENETPLVHRLRSRTRSSFKDSSDIEADGEDSEHERLPDRGAKRKAIEALKGGESDDAMDLAMDPVTEDTKGGSLMDVAHSRSGGCNASVVAAIVTGRPCSDVRGERDRGRRYKASARASAP